MIDLILKAVKGLFTFWTHGSRQAPAPREGPKQRNATLTWFDIQNIQTATCWAGGFTHRGKFKMFVCVGQNSSLFNLLKMKRIKSGNGRTFLQVFTSCSESVPGCQTWQFFVYCPPMRKNTVNYCITQPPPSSGAWRHRAARSRSGTGSRSSSSPVAA